MVERLSQDHNEITAQIQETGIPIESLQFFPHGIDKAISDRQKGFLYEENCFRSLNENIPSGLTIGPHIVDDMFCRRGHKTGGLIRPDGIWLDQENGTNYLRTFYEFKSGNLGTLEQQEEVIKKKSEGFDKLAHLFKQDPKLLPKMLRSVLSEEVVDLPDYIQIPDEVEVVFYHPSIQGPFDGVPSATFFNHPAPNIGKSSHNTYLQN